mmetsp:Transcript_66582/g.192259  ORF Transcript_66582/g.192259 Transcript_66582/m.192259 type:complete len:245 (-) Transcript_66582:49-783(-)
MAWSVRSPIRPTSAKISSTFRTGDMRTNSSWRFFKVASSSSSRQTKFVSSSLRRVRQPSSEAAKSFVCDASAASAFCTTRSVPDRFCAARRSAFSKRLSDCMPNCDKPASILAFNVSRPARDVRCASSSFSTNFDAASETLIACSAPTASTFCMQKSDFWPQASTLWVQASNFVMRTETCCSKLLLTRLSSVCNSRRRCCSATVCNSSSFAVMRVSKARTSLRCVATDAGGGNASPLAVCAATT